jgi:uncharacterized protein (TIGR02145 family)
MKKKFTLLVILLSIYSFAQVGIGTTSPNASAIIDVTSSSQGFLPPRMTTVQRNNITSPAQGLTIYNTDLKYLEVFNGVRWLNSASLSSTDVYSPTTGQIWMDRNLGATRVATSMNDFNAYGSLFQWGRRADGHELINWTSATAGTAVNSGVNTTRNDSPGNTFIRTSVEPFDWRVNSNSNLWQGASGTNNPCPVGYRIPTVAEWSDESASWTSQNAEGGFASLLKLCVTGIRNSSTGSITTDGTNSFYWTSVALPNQQSKAYKLSSVGIANETVNRSMGYAVRCIKN